MPLDLASGRFYAEERGTGLNQAAGWREKLGLGVVLLSLALGLSPFRIFPFSDFPIFARAMPRPEVIGLQTVDLDGGSHLLSGRMLFPFTRLAFHQSYLWVLKYDHDPQDAVRWIYDRVGRQGGKALRVVRLQMTPNPDGQPPYQLLKVETLHEMAY